MEIQNQNEKIMKNYRAEKVQTLSKSKAREYVTKYFIPLSCGDHARYVDGKYEIIDDSTAKRVYFNRMPKEVSKYYFTEFTKIRTIEYKLNKPVLHDDKLNLCPKMMHTYKPYAGFSQEIKNRVNEMLNYIKCVLCSDSKESSDFVVKWLSNMIKGNKNNSCLYMKGPQGLGKSTLPEFLRFYVIGEDLTLETGSGPLKSNFNEILGGKLFVYFEELENFSTAEWNVISSRLKRQLTSSKIVLEKKGIDAYTAENMNNYMLISNNDAIKDDDGRRIDILDVSAKYTSDVKYWDSIYGNCMNKEVGEAFYCYLMEIDTNKFNPQQFPISNNKKDAFAKRLDPVYVTLKEVFIKENKNIDCSVQELFDLYVDYCRVDSLRSLCKIEFNKKLGYVNINHYKSGALNRYKVSHEELVKIALKHNWLHDLDDYDVPKTEEAIQETIKETVKAEIKKTVFNFLEYFDKVYTYDAPVYSESNRKNKDKIVPFEKTKEVNEILNNDDFFDMMN